MHYIIPLIAFLGLPIGKIIGYYTKDELEQARVYFYAAKKLILFILAVILSLTFLWNINALIFFIVGILAAKLIKLTYLWLGLAQAVSLTPIIPASLIFTYSLIKGSQEKSFIKEAISFFLPFSLLLTQIPIDLLTKFAAGALLFTAIFGEWK